MSWVAGEVARILVSVRNVMSVAKSLCLALSLSRSRSLHGFESDV